MSEKSFVYYGVQFLLLKLDSGAKVLFGTWKVSSVLGKDMNLHQVLATMKFLLTSLKRIVPEVCPN